MRSGVLLGFLLLSPLALAQEGGESALESAFNRYERLVLSSYIEDMWVHKRRAFDQNMGTAESNIDARSMDLKARQEWYLRLGPSAVDLGLDDLQSVRDAQLLDELLWALLQESTQGRYWYEGVPWHNIKQSLASFLRRHSLLPELLAQHHGAWWSWIVDRPPLRGQEPVELASLRKLNQARLTGDGNSKAFLYMESLLLVESDLSSNHRNYYQEVLRAISDNSAQRQNLIQQIAQAYNKHLGLPKVFRLLAEEAESSGALEKSVDLYVAYLMNQKMRTVDDVVRLADLHYRKNEYEKALYYYKQSLQHADVSMIGRFVREKIEARTFLSQYALGQLKGVQAYEAFERATDRFFTTHYRDEILQSYAHYWESQKEWDASVHLWLWIYQYSLVRENRIEGLRRASSHSAQLIADRAAPLSQRKEWANRWTSLLKAWRRVDPKSSALKIDINKAQSLLRDPLYLDDSVLRANLQELTL